MSEDKRSGRLVVVFAAVVVLVGGAWVLWDMRPKESAHTEPTERLKILGRDDPATLREDEALKPHHTQPSASSAPASASAPVSASPSAR